MAPVVQQLYELQHLDIEIAKLAQQADQLTAAIGDQFKVKAGDLAIKQAEDALRKTQAAQRDREYELSALETRIKDHEQRLYSGKGSPRDLQALQADIEKDRARRGAAEEQALAAMEQAEKARAEVERVRGAVARVLSEVSTGKEKQAAERDQVQQQLTRRGAQRDALASTVPAQAMQLYDRLRQRVPDGLPVARVVQQRCEGCKDNLPSAEIQRARHAETPVQCASCQRILLVS
ncbi:MAG TPA: C4-type zinc ribbon domain-containing protein [Chloroflexota bacterium]|nr:C4-type zinc ribbon domain-containing protein [Chloroflexota bacterium]